MTRARANVCAVFAMLALSAGAHGAKMDSPADLAFDARMRELESELRCLVCQNQTLADSNADLADDLRREVRTLARSGKSDDEIKAYLVQRYGDFVLYRPPVRRSTLLLWGGPFALLAGGALLWSVVLRRRQRLPDPTVVAGDDALERARRALDG
ncbi:MAG: cytochrome c-type biogenesis protein [Betaproteobacteria bacterium]